MRIYFIGRLLYLGSCSNSVGNTNPQNFDASDTSSNTDADVDSDADADGDSDRHRCRELERSHLGRSYCCQCYRTPKRLRISNRRAPSAIGVRLSIVCRDKEMLYSQERKFEG